MHTRLVQLGFEAAKHHILNYVSSDGLKLVGKYMLYFVCSNLHLVYRTYNNCKYTLM